MHISGAEGALIGTAATATVAVALDLARARRERKARHADLRRVAYARFLQYADDVIRFIAETRRAHERRDVAKANLATTTELVQKNTAEGDALRAKLSLLTAEADELTGALLPGVTLDAA